MKPTQMSRTAQLAVLGLVGFGLPAWACTQIPDARVQQLIVACALVSVLGFFGTVYLVPKVASKTQARGICGKDLNKKGTPEGDRPVPEAVGLAPGCVFLLCVISFQLLHYYDISSLVSFVRSGFQGALRTEPIADAWLVDYNAALATIGFMLFLGFTDDVLDIRWRVKLILPLFAALPLLAAYSGGTGVAVPKPLLSLGLGLPAYLELGVLYKAFMVLLTIFCTNSINILAGVNGLEAGQTFIVACAVLLHNLLAVAGWAGATPAVRDGHLFSSYLMMPLAATTFGLLVFNWYPSRVFVGDTFTYFAGMTIAVAGILGHFSETLLLFLLPQVFNFVYSLPQLFKIVPCPRHRLPVFDPATGLLRPKDAPDWNLVNLTLQLFGRCGENALCIRVLMFQVLSCGLAFGLRYVLQGIYK
ncbi:UDP-N-acetylglucosamine--dolichyl-phosphate N-acetylglucosaminephosphotransferase [Tetrabaena socialis]|uniref:UDP-N-acetylglucosamine--dolichyl-phosphate N-acetylglucosaminephosphotransferase n=1 Tax=Tetrabaena socialis TaxID=47790 RepID=A0A2J8A4Z6_9CHLO|nr:UDP-N-acetylglucosamine--dolichyl-phosphate N-acetylglucosaminephosphotransferase [Tetrabaena socialis]|eukprot:PNH07577.1 UDP-N-acetylglucosamine--dolichyl-phosphate N-acetylglucosaminephosphotransferase [Tetrabaena socialis]